MSRSRQSRTRIPVMLCGSLGLALLSISAPQFLSAIYAHDAYQVQYQWSQGEPVAPKMINLALLGLEQAASYGVDLSGNATLRARLLTDRNDASTTDTLLQGAELTRAALSRRPLDGYLWTSLAILEYRAGGYSANVEAALERSYRFSPVETSPLVSRNVIAFREWDRLPSALVKFAKRDVAFMAQSVSHSGQVLAYLPDYASRQFVLQLTEHDADIDAIQRHAIWFKRQNGL